MNVVSNTDIGPRSENQDRVITAVLSDNTCLAVLCDGMGGENAGGLASELAVNMIYERINSGLRSDFDANSIKNLLVSAVYAANAIVFSTAADDETKEGMGTTCVVALIKDRRLHIVNVGDSRAYSIFGGMLEQLTTDHTVVRLLYDQGKIAADEMQNHPQRNLITRAVGASSVVDVDYFEYDVKSGSTILLCSDGLSSYCDEKRIIECINPSDIEQSAKNLIDLAIECKGKDNITVALISDL